LEGAAALAVYLGYSAHQVIGRDYQSVYGDQRSGVYINRSIKTILGIKQPARGDLAIRPDIVNARTRSVWEIKSGVLSYYLGSIAALADLDDYLKVLNKPKYNPTGGYHAGSGYDPIALSLWPYWPGQIMVDSDIDGTLVYYFDTATTEFLAMLAASGIRSNSASNSASVGGKIIQFPQQVPLPDVIVAVNF
jgi:hypothetical protein